MSFSYELKVISNRLPLAPDAIRKLAGQVVYKTAYDIEAHAKIIVPVDTGFLKNSIEVKPVSEMEAIITVGAEYGIHVEFGTRFMEAQPFIAPAVNAAKIPFESAMAQVLNPDNWNVT